MVPVVLLVTIALFALIRLTPGDPIRDEYGLEVTPELYQARRHQLGLDRPLVVQYLDWLKRLAQLDFGRSLSSSRPVKSVVFERFPATLELTTTAFIAGLAIAAVLGTLSAVYDRTIFSAAVNGFGLAAVSLPAFFFATLLVYFVQFRWRLLPLPGYVPFDRQPLENLRLLVLPAIALSYSALGLPTRLIRVNVLEALQQDYIRTARAKGLSRLQVVFRHSLRNALLPSVTLLGLTVATLWQGAFVIETIFNWPGMGRLALQSLRARDYPVVQAIVLLSALSFSLANLAVDLLYARLDPRISYVARR